MKSIAGSNVFSKCCAAAVVLSSFFLLCTAGSPRKQTTTEESKLQVKLSAERRTIHSGETLVLHVEIWNAGPDDLFICKDFFGPRLARFCDLRLSFNPTVRGGFPGVGVAVDGVPTRELPTFANALVANWLSIAPRHFYGEIIEINGSLYPELQVAGKYRLSATFSGAGMLVDSPYNGLQHYPDEVARLPGKVWTGEATSNTLNIIVLPKSH
jgi:hypothetical protein